MAKAVKLIDIAQMMNVSTVTVSKALSGKKGVSEPLREQIQKKAEELGYKQPSVLRGEKAAKSHTIGVLIAKRYIDRQASFYWEMYQELTAKAATKNDITSLEIISEEAERQLEMPKLIAESLVEGCVILGPVSEKYLHHVTGHTEIPFVYLDGADKQHEMDCIITDNYYGMYKMTEYLIDKGHDKIAFVGTVGATESITDRYFGYVKALTEHGISVREDWVLKDRSVERGLVEEYEISFPKTLPTAFVCNCDRTAAKVITQLEENGGKVPDDFSVVGFDNYLYAGLTDVPITSYAVDMKEMVSRCIFILRRKIAKEYYKKGVSVIEGRLSIKCSVKDINKARKVEKK